MWGLFDAEVSTLSTDAGSVSVEVEYTPRVDLSCFTGIPNSSASGFRALEKINKLSLFLSLKINKIKLFIAMIQCSAKHGLLILLGFFILFFVFVSVPQDISVLVL